MKLRDNIRIVIPEEKDITLIKSVNTYFIDTTDITLNRTAMKLYAKLEKEAQGGYLTITITRKTKENAIAAYEYLYKLMQVSNKIETIENGNVVKIQSYWLISDACIKWRSDKSFIFSGKFPQKEKE